MFYYDPEVIEFANWFPVEYTLKNIGHTEISHIYFSANLPKNTSLLGIENQENEMCYENFF